MTGAMAKNLKEVNWERSDTFGMTVQLVGDRGEQGGRLQSVMTLLEMKGKRRRQKCSRRATSALCLDGRNVEGKRWDGCTGTSVQQVLGKVLEMLEVPLVL